MIAYFAWVVKCLVSSFNCGQLKPLREREREPGVLQLEDQRLKALYCTTWEPSLERPRLRILDFEEIEVNG